MAEVTAVKHLSSKGLLGIAILSAVLSMVGTLWYGFLPSSARCILQGFGAIVMEPAEMPGLPWLVLLWVWPLILFSPTIRRKVDIQTLTYLYIVGFCVSGFSSHLTPWCNFIYFACSKGQAGTPAEWAKFIPSFVAVPTEVADKLLLGGEVIPWGTWIPVITWYFLFIGLFGIISVAVANIFRREWIDVEKVAFPQTMLATETLIQVEGGDRAARRKRFFVIGLIIGIIFTIPLAMILIFPWFPDIYSWRAYTCGPGSQQLSPDSVFYSMPLALHFAKHPIAYALCYLLPMSVLFSGWLFALIYIILVWGAFTMGYYTALTTTGSCGRLWCGELSPLMSPPLMLKSVGGGGIVGLGVMMLFFQRSYIARTLKAALGRLSGDELQAFEKDEPTSYRNSWAMLVTSFILLIVLLIGTGFSLVMAFLIVFMGVLIWIWQTRIFGLAAMHIEASGAANWLPRVLFYQESIGAPNTDTVLGAHIWVCTSGRHPLDGWGQSMFSAFSAYKVASLTGTSTKDAFKVTIISLLVAQLVGIITLVWSANTFGLSRMVATTNYWASNMEWWSTILMQQPATGPPSQWGLHFAAGFLLTVIMSVLHSRFVWFPHPLGPIITWSFGGTLFGWWLAFLVAWILKWLTLRIGGSKAYEEIGLPLAGGTTAGYALVAFIFGIAGVIRFFYPY